ncbi:MAG: flagellar hook-basal body complex protein [Clostridia bacterium]|jgi:flagellar hook protein FlgE|nr:flagellar hook-basal body complex protein [Clostridia bacterium]
MARSLFSGVAGMRAHQDKMDVIANNIANVNTYGYKSGRVTFKESLYQTTRASSNGTSTYGGTNPSQVGYGSEVGTVDLMYSTGAYSPTDSSTDCMIDGNGFFVLGPKDGKVEVDSDPSVTSKHMESTVLSRVGNFTIDGNGYLVNGDGKVVYGYPDPKDTSHIQPLVVPYVDSSGNQVAAGTSGASPMKLNSLSISSSGELTGTDSDGKAVTVGAIAVANVPNPNALEKTEGPYYTIRENTGDVAPYIPGEGTTGRLKSKGLEMSNVDLAKEFSEMITTERGFQANSKIITVSDEMLEDLVNLKR